MNFTQNNPFKIFSLLFLQVSLTVTLFVLEGKDFKVQVKTSMDDRTYSFPRLYQDITFL